MGSKTIILLLLAILALGNVSVTSHGSNQSIQKLLDTMRITRVKEKVEAPNFIMTKMSTGQKVSLKSYRGKVVFLNFWATWCPPCREEMPSMDDLNKKLKKRRFAMLAVSYENEDILKDFQDLNNYSFEIANSAGAEEKYGITSIPQTFIIDPKGYIIAHKSGGMHWNTAEAYKLFNILTRN